MEPNSAWFALLKEVWAWSALLGVIIVTCTALWIRLPEAPDRIPLNPVWAGVALIGLGPFGAIGLGIIGLIKLARLVL